MGVYYSVTIGYGFRLSEDDLTDAFKKASVFDELGMSETIEELFYSKPPRWPLLTFATLGSYYESGKDAITDFICVKRLTRSMDAYESPGGEFVVNNAEPTKEEVEQLNDISLYLTGKQLEPRSFAGGLWH